MADRPEGVRRELDLYMKDQILLKPSIRERIRMEKRNIVALESALDQVKPDVVSVWHMATLSFSLLTLLSKRKIPVVLVVCDDWLIDAPEYDCWLSPFLGRPLLARAASRLTGLDTRLPVLGDEFTACYVSQWISDRAERLAPFSISRSTITYTGIETHEFSQGEQRERTWRWKLLCVGRPDNRKGMHLAVQAMPHLPAETTLDIIGRGNENDAKDLRDLVLQLRLEDRVRFDYVPRSELKNRYALADTFLFPVVWDEPFGLVPIEAMACGTPVIATGTGGSAEFMVDGVNSLLIPKNDERALANAITRLAEDPALRVRLITGGIKTAAILDTDSLASNLEEWHLAAAEGFRRGGPAPVPTPIERLGSLR